MIWALVVLHWFIHENLMAGQDLSFATKLLKFVSYSDTYVGVQCQFSVFLVLNALTSSFHDFFDFVSEASMNDPLINN